ncbi:MAG: class I SAM-dependent methyltransferase [Oscillospiraceae bacterium]|nr:class I SAM-dependent methyltransferase [Oscillospiraceae bacterium]
MKNEYENDAFFDRYAQMSRSREGLAGAGEWHRLRPLFPALESRRVLDLGCGYGWHCKYAAEHGAAEVLGLDMSAKMLGEAKRRNSHKTITYRLCGIEEYEYPEKRWDCVLSNLALHYIEDLDAVFQKVWHTLVPGGVFLFNIEHPVFTAGVAQDWEYDEQGKPRHWPVDDYFRPGLRLTRFLGCPVEKQHHTLTQILMGLLENGFELEAVEEAQPSAELLEQPGMADELRRPMMLLVRARARK